MVSLPRWVVFDLDGTLVDSDLALVEPFVRLGVPRESVTFGHLLVDECKRFGITRLGWEPAVALFAEDFGGVLKHLAPVLERLDVDASDVVFVGDTAHDRVCALDGGARFALAAWNDRAVAVDGDIVLARPDDLLDAVDLSG